MVAVMAVMAEMDVMPVMQQEQVALAVIPVMEAQDRVRILVVNLVPEAEAEAGLVDQDIVMRALVEEE
jgi:hypothetical protein